MNYGLIEATERCHIGINVKRVGVFAQPVNEALVGICLDFELSIGSSIGRVGYRLRFIISFMSESSNSSDEVATINMISFIFFTSFSNFIKVLSDNNNSIFSFILAIKDFELSLIFSIKRNSFFDHVEFFFTMKQIVKRKLRKVWATKEQFKSWTSFHGRSHRGEWRKTFKKFVGIFIVFFFKRIYIVSMIPKLNPIPTAYSNPSFSVIVKVSPLLLNPIAFSATTLSLFDIYDVNMI